MYCAGHKHRLCLLEPRQEESYVNVSVNLFPNNHETLLCFQGEIKLSTNMSDENVSCGAYIMGFCFLLFNCSYMWILATYFTVRGYIDSDIASLFLGIIFLASGAIVFSMLTAYILHGAIVYKQRTVTATRGRGKRVRSRTGPSASSGRLPTSMPPNERTHPPQHTSRDDIPPPSYGEATQVDHPIVVVDRHIP